MKRSETRGRRGIYRTTAIPHKRDEEDTYRSSQCGRKYKYLKRENWCDRLGYGIRTKGI